ncbi:MAG: subclass B1 metallo-beta-lactamase [Tannerella sp.]|jgi:metallo-beta-lactamase class B|nr:subclass B1 metallo-beta-lactamase [Tannerella sp.]
MNNKTKLLITLFLLFQLAGYAQTLTNKIKVSDDIELIQLSPKAYVHMSVSEIQGFGKVSSNGLILVDKEKAFLFDTPVTDEQTKTLVNFIADSLYAKVVGFVPNHWHEDCMGGLAYLNKKKIKSYANQKTIDIAKEKGLPVPKKGFKDSLFLKLNDVKIDCYYLGGGHTTDNIVVWIPSEKILFAGCMVKEMSSKTPGNLSDADMNAWPSTIEKVIDKFPSEEIVIPGHGRFGGKELLTHTRDLLTEKNDLDKNQNLK